MRRLSLTYRGITDLKPQGRNPRTHSAKQIAQIVESIKTFGWTNPILIDDDDRIIAGHGRLKAAEAVGLSEVPTIRLSDMTEAEKRAYVIADNKLAENAGWDQELLALELQGLSELNLDFDLTVTGFEAPEIDVLIQGLQEPEQEDDPDDRVIPPGTGPCVTRPGDLWRIGSHRLICGDARDPDVFRALLNGSKAQMVFTDPPYNVAVNGHVCGLGGIHHREFAMACGEMSPEAFTAFLRTCMTNLATHSLDGAIHFVCMDWRHMGEVLGASSGIYSELKNLCVWAKTNGGMGSLYRSQHELVFVYKVGTAPHINNVELGRHGRYRTNLWSYPGINAFSETRANELALHPTVKPVQLVADAILDCSSRGHIVLDAFAGSGTTLLAAERTGRRAFGVEIDPHYCDVILRRMAEAAGLEACLEATGQPFPDVMAERTSEARTGPDQQGCDVKEMAHAAL